MSDPEVALTEDQKLALRKQMVDTSKQLIDIPYATAKTEEERNAAVGKWVDLTSLPKNLDCSGLTAGLCHGVKLKFPDGAQAQYNFTQATTTPRPGDFAFFGHNGDITKVDHVGMVYDDKNMIEARAYQPGSSFATGKVILRARAKWEGYKPFFLGYRSHPKLA